MATTSQGAVVTFDGTALAEVTNVTATSTSEAQAAGANDNRIDVSHLGLAAGSDRLYLANPLVDVAYADWLAANGGGETGTAPTGDVSVDMYGTPPSSGAKGALTVSGGGMAFSATCVQVTSSAITLAVGEVAKASVTFTVVDPAQCD